MKWPNSMKDMMIMMMMIKITIKLTVSNLSLLLIPVPARSKAWICGRSPAGIVVSNPVGGISVYCECCSVR